MDDVWYGRGVEVHGGDPGRVLADVIAAVPVALSQCRALFMHYARAVFPHGGVCRNRAEAVREAALAERRESAAVGMRCCCVSERLARGPLAVAQQMLPGRPGEA